MTQPPGPYGPPQPAPPRMSLLPWLIVGGALLLSGAGIALVLLLRGGEGSGNSAATSTSSSPAATSTSARPTGEQSLGDLPGGAQVAEPTVTAGNAFVGSDEVAAAFVDGGGGRQR